MSRASQVFVLFAFALCACGDDGAQGPADASDAGVDGGDRPELGLDGGDEDAPPPRDLGPDVSPDATLDGGDDDAGDAGDASDAGCTTRMCAGECCAEGEECGPVTGRCIPPCPSGVLCGDDLCCAEGERCDPVLRACGFGCPPEASCGGMCCAEGELCDIASGGCVMGCAGGVFPCGDVCCAPGESCDTTRDLCVPPCPTARACGDACCDDFEICGPRTMLCVPSCGGAPPCGPGDVCCGDRERCAYDACVLDLGPCADDGDCDDDSWCDAGRCTPYGVGPRPTMAPVCEVTAPPGVVAPAVECTWSGSEVGDPFGLYSQVLTTPVVVDLDLDVDPTTRRPTIVIAAHNGTRDDASVCGGSPISYAVLRGIDATRCVTELVIDEPVSPTTSPAAADLDGDGRPELVAVDGDGRVVAFRFDVATRDWAAMWRSTDSRGGVSAPVADRCHWAGLAVADMDDDGVPEVLLGGLAYRGDTGALVAEGPALSTAIGNGIGPVVADVDLDGRQELVAGTGVFELDATAGVFAREPWSPAGTSEGWVGLADFGSFDALGGPDAGYPEVVVVASGTVRVQTIDGRVIFGPIVHPGVAPAFFGGPPAIADLDGDGVPEIAVGGGSSFAVFDLECTSVVPGRCEAVGIRWTEPIDDTTSARTAPAVFDFEGDGRAEVAFADECFMRIWDGSTGDAILGLAHSSCTWSEGPVVADVDLDGRAELVVPENAVCGVACPDVDPSFRGQHCASDSDCGGGAGSCEAGYCRCTSTADCLGAERICRPPIPGTPGRGRNVCRARHPLRTFDGVRVIGDVLGRWSPSRPVWNEHAYSVTNVRDDGRVPRSSDVTPSWSSAGGNVFRGQVAALGGPSSPGDAPDLTLRFGARITCSSVPPIAHAEVCNRGTRATTGTVSVAFYDELPRSAGALRCTAVTSRPVMAGECLEVSCNVGSEPLETGELFGFADDDGEGNSAVVECIETNNEGHGVCESL